MQASRRAIAATAVGLILLGFVCPNLCVAGAGPTADATPHAEASATPMAHCHGADEGAAPARDEAPSDDRGCVHCDTTAASSTVDLTLDLPSLLAIAPATLIDRPTALATADPSRLAHAPPRSRPLILLKRSLLL
jgi:hypothetical protein